MVLERLGQASPPAALKPPAAPCGPVSAGILARRKDGNRVYFQANADCPFLAELQGLIAKTVGLVDVLRDALAGLERQLEVVFIHGSVAKSREHSGSDVDLIAIGTLGLSELSPALEAAERHWAGR